MTVVPLIGSILLLCLPKSAKWGIVVATWLAACTNSLMLVSYSMIASNVKGNTKKSVVSGMFFMGYTTGCIVGPQLWQAVDAPRYESHPLYPPDLSPKRRLMTGVSDRYTKGDISSIVCWVLLLATFTFNYFYLRHENRKREALGLGRGNETELEEEGARKTEEHVGIAIDSDLTDRQDLDFRYTS